MVEVGRVGGFNFKTLLRTAVRNPKNQEALNSRWHICCTSPLQCDQNQIMKFWDFFWKTDYLEINGFIFKRASNCNQSDSFHFLIFYCEK